MKHGNCLNCGKEFDYQPSNSSGKYCSWECLQEHRERMSVVRTGLTFRKTVMRAGLHHDETFLKVWARLRNASEEERYVILYDLMKEHEQVDAEVKRMFGNLKPATKRELDAIMGELEVKFARAVNRRPEQFDEHVKCENCGRENTRKAGRCLECGKVINVDN